MNVSYIVTRPMVVIGAEKSVLAAAELMVKNNIGLLVVTQPGKQELRGVISERDIIRVVASGRPLETPVEQVCTKNVVTVRADSEVGEAAKAMNKHGIRHVVVVDEHGKATGVISMRDLVGERATLTAILQSHEKEIFHGAD
jgi:CBS domain-containing protein